MLYEILYNVPEKLKTRSTLEPSLSIKFSLFQRNFSPYNDHTRKKIKSVTVEIWYARINYVWLTVHYQFISHEIQLKNCSPISSLHLYLLLSQFIVQSPFLEAEKWKKKGYEDWPMQMFDVARRKFIKKTSVKYSFNNKELRLPITKAVKRIGNNITIYYLNADIIKINLEKSITRTTSKFMLLLNFRKRHKQL